MTWKTPFERLEEARVGGDIGRFGGEFNAIARRGRFVSGGFASFFG
jgi:hypothetical protein